MELNDGFELKAGDFKNVNGLRGASGDEFDDWEADIAADLGGNSRILEYLTKQGRRGGLAIGASDCNDAAFEEARGEFEFANYGKTEGFHLDEFRGVERNTWADDNEVLAAEGEQAVSAGLDADAVFEECGDFFGESGRGAHVGDGYVCALLAQKQGRGQAGFA